MIETLEKLPPHSIEAEQSLLGSLLLDRDAIIKVAPFLRTDDFYRDAHARVYESIVDLYNRREPPDLITVHEELSRSGDAEQIGGASYLTWLMNSVPTSVHVEYYGRIVERTATMRRLIGAGSEIAGIGYEEDTEVGEAMDRAEQTLYRVAQRRSGGDLDALRDALAQFFDRLDYLHQHRGEIVGVPTGFHDLDQLTGGLQRSDLIIVAGRPGMGKTALATNVAYNVARAWRGEQQPDGAIKTVDGGIVGFFSLEMSSEQLATRIISEQTEIPSSKIRRGEITETDFEKLVACSQTMQKIPLFIDQTGGISIAQLAARARRLKRQRGLDVIVIDYIQLMQGSSAKSSQNRVQEITEITTGLKALGKELGVPIIALSQLSRQVESRDDKRPQLSDLRESGSIEQDADVVLFVYREEYYLRNKEPKPGTEEYIKWETELNEMRGKAEVIIAKQRHGPTGSVSLAFTAEFTRFSDLAEEHHLPDRYE